ncbi:carboxypeptidase-like regulatory domain-containing protein [Flavobacterium sp.]|uniref:TonB-dependent receptor n=1 Tax=Flavobacterium sp. TaxID=239 RepID=UPI0038FCA3F6
MKLRLLFIALLVSALSFSQEKGTIKGIVTDKDFSNAPLPFVNIILKNKKIATNSDAEGKYQINVPVGNYVLQYSFVGYETIEMPITVKAGETIVVNKALGSGSYKLQDVVVQGASKNREKETAILLDQKNAVVFKQSIGAQEMARKGVSDVEDGLTKISGITKVDGRGLFVRGLEDRYNNLLINDLAVPSNNPFKKIIPLDIFPTDIVSVLETFKTFNPNIYGDFAGATFNIVTSRAGKKMTKISFGTSFTTNNNLKKFLISSDANSTKDFFGFSGEERQLPSEFGKVPSNKTLSINEALTGFDSGFNVEETKSPLNTSIGILHSEKFNVGKKNHIFQYLLSLNFENKYQYRDGVDRFFNIGQGNYDNDLKNEQFKYSSNTSALVTLNFKTTRLDLTSNTFYLKSTENMIQNQEGYTNGAPTNNGFIRLNQLEKTDYLNTQLQANYKLTSNEKHNLKGAVSFTKNKFEQPDRKSFKGVKTDDQTTLINYEGNNIFRQYFDVDGKSHIAGLLEYSWKFGNEDFTKAHKFTAGYNGYMNNVESVFRFLVSNRLGGGSGQVSVLTNTPDATFANEILNYKFTYREGSAESYKTKLSENVNAGYIDFFFRLSEKLELNFGTRAEQTIRETKYRELGQTLPSAYLKKTITKLDILPTLNAKFKVNDKSNLRFAASKSITRPVLMEAIPVEYVNLDGTIVNGNKDVINSDNYNFDLKYELFPTNKELFAVTAFSKIIQNPIERIFQPTAGSGGQIITFDNSEKAFLVGAEFEFNLQLERISNALSQFSLGFNTSLMQSKVTIAKDNALETNPDRALQGASPWLINTDLKYDFEFNKDWTNTITFVYNVYGKRIYAVGTAGLDHYYEQSFNKLDFVWASKVGKNWDLKLGVDNILDPVYRIKLGEESKVLITEEDLTVKSFKRGVGFSFNLGYTF